MTDLTSAIRRLLPSAVRRWLHRRRYYRCGARRYGARHVADAPVCDRIPHPSSVPHGAYFDGQRIHW